MSYTKSRKSARSLGILASVMTIVFMLFSISRAMAGRGKSSAPSKAITKAFKGTKYEALTPYVIAMAKHETAGYDPKKSLAFELNNNLFGMQRPMYRNTTDTRKGDLIVEGKLMAHYPNHEASAKDLILWMDQWRTSPFPTRVNSTHEFATALKGGNQGRKDYYTDSVTNYSRGMSSWS